MEKPVLIRILEEKDKHGKTVALCKCFCGEEFKREYTAIKTGKCKSCGCKSGRFEKKHGDSNSPTYYSWVNMKRRCYVKHREHYVHYGERGIEVCERWLGDKGFQNFVEDMGERPSRKHTLDRIDSDKGYYKENCRWATSKEQQNNRTNNHRITYRGETKTLTIWAEEYGLTRGVLSYRLRNGWDIERALTTPIDTTKWSKKKTVDNMKKDLDSFQDLPQPQECSC